MQPNEPYQQNTTPPANDYSFIVDPTTSTSGKKSLPGAGSPIARAVVVVVGLFVLIILFVGVKGLLSSGSNGPLFLGVVQDQQAMLHITEAATKEPSISKSNKDFAYTADLSLTSDRSKTVSYLSKTGTKLKDKQVNLKISLSLDKQLADAAAASSYNTVFPQIMKAKLTNYDQALQQANAKTKGLKGRALLKSEHNNTVLLLKQLEAANR